MKKTTLKLTRTTVRVLSGPDLATARGGRDKISWPCPDDEKSRGTAPTCNPYNPCQPTTACPISTQPIP